MFPIPKSLYSIGVYVNLPVDWMPIGKTAEKVARFGSSRTTAVFRAYSSMVERVAHNDVARGSSPCRPIWLRMDDSVVRTGKH